VMETAARVARDAFQGADLLEQERMEVARVQVYGHAPKIRPIVEAGMRPDADTVPDGQSNSGAHRLDAARVSAAGNIRGGNPAQQGGGSRARLVLAEVTVQVEARAVFHATS
jgi:hypothetical protein